MVDEELVVVDSLLGVVREQIHVAAGVEGFFEPAALGEALDHLGDDGVVAGAVFFGAGDFGEEVELEGGAVVGGGREVFGFLAAEMFELQVADGAVDFEGVAVGGGEAGVVLDGVILGLGFAVVLGVEELVGADFAVGGGGRLAEGLELGEAGESFVGGGLVDEDGAEDGGGSGVVAGELIGCGRGCI